MDVASDRVKHIQSSRLRLLKEMQERRVLGELSKTEAQRRMANLATQNAFRELAKAQQHCSTAEAALYQELMTFDDLSSASLDRHNLHIERLAAEITRSREMLDNARIAEEQADAAASETRKGDVTLFDQRPKSRLSVNSGNCSGHGFPLRHGADPMNMGG